MSFRVCFAAMVASVLCLPGQAHALQSQCLTLPRDALGPPDPGQVTDEIPVHLAVAPAAQAEAASLFVVTQSFNWPASPSFNNSAAVQGGDPVDEWNHAPSGPITGDDEYLIYIAPEDTTPGLVAITADSELLCLQSGFNPNGSFFINQIRIDSAQCGPVTYSLNDI